MMLHCRLPLLFICIIVCFFVCSCHGRHHHTKHKHTHGHHRVSHISEPPFYLPPDPALSPDDPPSPFEATAPPPFEATAPPPFEATAPPPFKPTAPPPFKPTAPPPFKATAPPPFKATAPPPFETTAPPPFETTAPPPFEVTAPPPFEVTAPPPFEATAPPPFEAIAPPPPVEATAPPPFKAIAPPPFEAAAPPPFEATAPPPFKAIAPPPFEATAPPPFKAIAPPPFEAAAPPPFEAAAPPPFEATAPPPFKAIAPPPFEAAAPPPFEATAPPPVKATAPPPFEATAPPPNPTTTYSPPKASAPAPETSAPSPSDNVYDNYSSSIFDVRHFGAVGDGITDDTEAFKLAWDTACSSQNESALIRVPSGFSFLIQSTIFTGPCQGGLVLQIDGTLMPPDGPESWPKNLSRRQWLVFYRINQMSLRGAGVIDGRGQKWWDLPCKPHKGVNGTTLPGPCDSPIAIKFFMSSNLSVQGLKVKNSPQFNFRFDNCKNVHIENLRITAPALSPNTDGIHIENTNNVQIYNSAISNGDDCVSIGSGCYDVDIKNVTCGPSHGISIGSLGNHNSRACVSNITVRDSVIKLSANGVRIKTWQGGSGAVSGVTFSNIHMENVRNPIIIDQFYCLTRDCSNKTSAVLVSDIQYQSIKGTYDIRSPPMHFGCSDSVPCTNLTLSDIELMPAQGDIMLDPFCWNAYGDLQTLTIPPVSCLMEGVPSSLLDSVVGYC